MMKKFTNGTDPLKLLAERENVFHVLPQTSPKKLASNHAAYTINPATRYPSVYEVVRDTEVTHLYDTDKVISPAVGPTNESGHVQKKPKGGSPDQAKKVKGTGGELATLVV